MWHQLGSALGEEQVLVSCWPEAVKWGGPRRIRVRVLR